MNNKHDKEFLVQAADSDLRGAAIAEITSRRTVLIWAVGIVTLGVFVIGFMSKQPSIYSVLVCCIMWTLLYKSDSDLKLLQVIERLSRDDKRLPNQSPVPTPVGAGRSAIAVRIPRKACLGLLR